MGDFKLRDGKFTKRNDISIYSTMEDQMILQKLSSEKFGGNIHRFLENHIYELIESHRPKTETPKTETKTPKTIKKTR